MRGDGVRTFLRGLGQTLITLGVVVLLFCVYELYFTNLYTDKEQDRLGDAIHETWAGPPPPSPAPGQKLAKIPIGSGFAIMWIPRIGMVGKDHAKVVVEGIGTEDLKRGPGHYPDTARPGEIGNMVISGHRTTYGAPFNRLDELRTGDAIVVETRDSWFTYRVTGQEVVKPSAVEVTYAVPRQRNAVPTKRLMTLTTCNPKYSATTRLIVFAELDTALPKSQGGPPALTGGA